MGLTSLPSHPGEIVEQPVVRILEFEEMNHQDENTGFGLNLISAYRIFSVFIDI